MSRFIEKTLTLHRWSEEELLSEKGSTCLCFKVRMFGKLHVLKRLRPEFSDNPKYVDLLRKEFLCGYNLSHPNLVRYASSGMDNTGIFLLTDYVDGRTLEEILQTDPSYFEDSDNLHRFIIQLLDVLGYLHQHQIVHLDLSLGNIMITRVGNDVKLLDLGYCYSDTYDNSMGMNEAFASPEQLNDTGQVDARTDLYAVGCLLQHIAICLSARSLPVRYRHLLSQLCQKNQKERPANCEEAKNLILPQKRIGIFPVKWMILVFVLLTVLASWLYSYFSHPYDFEVDGVCYNILSEDSMTCEVTYRKFLTEELQPEAYSGSIRIPSSVWYRDQEYRVTAVGSYAFCYSLYLTDIELPPTITSLGACAFRHCHLLETISMSDHVTQIGDTVFDQCHNLRSVHLSPSIRSIPVCSFSNCFSLPSISIPEGVESIGRDAFGNCYALEEIHLPSTLKEIGRGAFWNCHRLPQIDIPANVAHIDNYVFNGCDSLHIFRNHSVLPQSVTSIFGDSVREDFCIYVPQISDSLYRNTELWNRYTIITME